MVDSADPGGEAGQDGGPADPKGRRGDEEVPRDLKRASPRRVRRVDAIHGIVRGVRRGG